MTRKVLIIINPGKIGDEHYCQGVNVDLDNYKSFFKSPYGGYWDDKSEIMVLEKPSLTDLNVCLLSLNNYDYSIIVFCGHGFYSSISSSNILELNDNGERFDSNKFKNNCAKRLIILDCCREVHKEYIRLNEGGLLRKSQMFSDSFSHKRLNPEDCKKYYNQTVSKCTKQIIVAYGAEINELAGDSSSKGGYYSSSLLDASVEIGENLFKETDLDKDFNVASFPQCHENSKSAVLKKSGNKQHPQIDKPRATKYLPFVVVA